MPIRWDPVLVRQLSRELDAALAGARLRAIRLDGDARDLVLLFRDRTLVWRLHPDRGYLRLGEPVEPEPTDLRLRARVRGVESPADERLLRFRLLAEKGRRGPLELVVELVGTRWNAVVVEWPDAVVRHALVRRDGRRRVAVGHPWAPPPPRERLGADGRVDLDAWRAVLESTPPEERAGALVRSFAWTSGINAPTVLGSAGSSADGGALARALERWRGFATGTDVAPVVLEGEDGLQPYPFPLDGVAAHPVDDLLAAFERCEAEARARGDVPAAVVVGPELIARLEDALDRSKRRVERLSAQLDGLDDPVRLRAVGDLILARFSEIGSGRDEVTLTGFDGEAVEVALDPALRPDENADRYYRRAGRSERAAERLPGMIEQAERARDRWAGLVRRVAAGDATPDEVRAALPAAPQSGRGGARPAAPPYRTFRSSGGLEIRVGRGARHNDDLTFRHASPDDVWLHARHAAGAHVVLRWPGRGAPPSRDLEEAANLAALHSRARTSGSVPVDWTLRKHVRKPRGSAPGAVLPERVRTIFVAPDPTLLESLAEGD